MAVSAEIRAQGEDFVRWFMEQPELIAQVQPISKLFSIEPVELRAGDGFASLRYTVPPGFANFRGTVHGGIVSTLLDEASAIAACTMVGGAFRGTVSCHVTYYAPTPIGAVSVQAQVEKITGTMIFVDARLHRGDIVHARAHSILSFGEIRTVDPNVTPTERSAR